MQTIKLNTWGVPALLALFYLVFPTLNSTGDAMGYAIAREIGPHHVLYDQCISWVNALCGYSPLLTLKVMKILNALIAGSTLFVSLGLLKKLNIVHPHLWTLLAGATFGFMRYATENEAYIFPLFFAALSLFHIYNYLTAQNRLSLWLGIFSIAMAVLFHQSYVFWFAVSAVVLLVHRSKVIFDKIAVVFATLFIGLVYLYYAHLNGSLVLEWIFQDAREGLVDLTPNIGNFIFTGVSFIRTFVQVHGNVWVIFKISPLAMVAGFISIFLFVIAMIKAVKAKKNSSEYPSKSFFYLVLFACIVQLLFAWFSEGNAEFMVMLPFLLILIFTRYFTFPKNSIVAFSAALFLWNAAAATVPSALLDFNNRAEQHKIFQKLPRGIFISYNRVQIENYVSLYLDTGNQMRCTNASGIYQLKLMKSPADIENINELSTSIKYALKRGEAVYTDCVIHPTATSRHSLLSGNTNVEFFKNYKMQAVDSFKNIYGSTVIHRIISAD